MLLQLQFIANGIIRLLSQSITSLQKLISMIIHWNHHENTLSWWVFPSQCSWKEWTHPYKKSCYAKYHPLLFNLQCRWTMPSDFSTILKDSVPSWKQQPDFIFIHNSQEMEMQIEVAIASFMIQCKVLSVCVPGAQSQFICSFNKYLFLIDFRQIVQPLCASISFSEN